MTLSGVYMRHRAQMLRSVYSGAISEAWRSCEMKIVACADDAARSPRLNASSDYRALHDAKRAIPMEWGLQPRSI